MSRIDELIKEKCPDGVKYKTLGETCEIKTGAGITKKDATEDGAYPIISGGIEPLGMYNRSNRKAKTVTIARAGGAGYVNYIKTDFYLNDKCFSIIPAGEYSNSIDSRFLYFVLKNMEKDIMDMKSTGSVPTVNTQKVAKIKIPIPPLEIQQEIVRMLNSFTELEAELEAELTKRKQQYEYYRDHLLSFENIAGEGGQVEWLTLEELLSYEQPGKYIVESTDYNDSFSIPVLTAGQSFILGYTNEANGVYSATQERPVIIFDDFTTSFHWVDFDFKVKSSAMKILSLKNSENNFRYIFYAMQCIKYTPGQHSRQWIERYSKIKVPIPPKSIQERIVYVLDNFDTVCNDLNIGLPAEIEVRHRQYEYYRDKLLTFKEI